MFHRKLGNLVIGLGTVGAQLGHKIVFPGAHLGHSWGTVGADTAVCVNLTHLGHTWGTKLLGAHLGQIQLGASWGTFGTKMTKVNNLLV